MQETDNDKDTPNSEVSALGSSPEGGGREGADYYLNEKGLITFTSSYHLKRGYCCGSGCRHCPYDYESVPEPKQSWLIENRNNTKADFSE